MKENEDLNLKFNFFNHVFENVVVLGKIVDIQVKELYDEYILDDGTDLFPIYSWKNFGHTEKKGFVNLEIGIYIKVFGKLESSAEKSYILSFNISNLTNSNQITCHFLDIIKFSNFIQKDGSIKNDHDSTSRATKLFDKLIDNQIYDYVIASKVGVTLDQIVKNFEESFNYESISYFFY